MRRARTLVRGARIVCYDAFLMAASRLPAPRAAALAGGLGRRAYRRASANVAPSVRRTVATSLDADREDVERLLERSFALAACEHLDWANFPRLTPATLPRVIEMRGRENLDAALERGRGAILVSGHLRGHYAFFAALGVLGYRPNILGQAISSDQHPMLRRRDERRDAVLRDRLGCRFLLMRPGNFGVAVEAGNALRRNEVVTIEIDHTFSEQNLEHEFLGRPARFPTGPFLLARGTGAPLLDFFIHRGDGLTPQIAEIGTPIEVGDDPAEALRLCVERLEGGVRRHPESWSPWLFPRQHVWEQVS